MDRWRWGLIAIAVAWGWWLPEFYDWSGEDQSRAAPVVRWIALGILALDAVAIGWLLWRHCKEPGPKVENTTWDRFGIRHILVATALVAIVVTAQRMIELPLMNGLVLASVVCAVWIAIKQPSVRGSIATMLVCLGAPFLWVLRWPEFHKNILEMFLLIPGLPMLLPALWSSQLLGWNKMGETTLPGLYTLIELTLGLWIVRFGPKPALAYSLIVLTASLVNSFVFQALVRM